MVKTALHVTKSEEGRSTWAGRAAARTRTKGLWTRKGRMKEAAGSLSGDKDKKSEGRSDQRKGKVKDKKGKAKDLLK